MSATTRELPLPISYPLNLLKIQRITDRKRKERFPEISMIYQTLSVNIGFVEPYLHLIQFEARFEVYSR